MAFKYANEYKLYEKEQKLDQAYYKQNQEMLNKWNLESAQKQMDFQKMMSDTSHQREVNDLLKAGLNPVLSANNGASTPSGAYATVDSTPVTAAAQSRTANRQMRQAMIQNKMQLANAYKIAKYQAQMQYAAQKYATDMNYQLGMNGYANQMDMALLPYQNVNATDEYKWTNTSADTKYGVDNPNTISGAIIKGAQGVIDTIFGTKGQTLRGQAGSLSNPSWLLKNGLNIAQTAANLLKVSPKLYKQFTANYNTAKNAANYLKQKSVDLSNFTGDIGYIPQGRPYHTDGTPFTDSEMKKLVRLYSEKTKLGKKNMQLWNSLANNIRKQHYIKKAKNS